MQTIELISTCDTIVQMIRTNISFTRELYEWVREEAHKLGISIAKYIRNLIEEKKNGKNTE